MKMFGKSRRRQAAKERGESKRTRKEREESRVERGSRRRGNKEVNVSVTTNDLLTETDTRAVQKKTLSNNAKQRRRGIKRREAWWSERSLCKVGNL